MRRRDVLGLAAAVAPWAGVWAHPMPNTVLVMQIGSGRVEFVAYVPISELKAATHGEPAGAAGRYLLEHAEVIGADGRAWRKALGPVEPDTRDGLAVMTVTAIFLPPPGSAQKAAALRYDAVNHRIASHFVLVYRRVGEALVPLARLQMPTTDLPLP